MHRRAATVAAALALGGCAAPRAVTVTGSGPVTLSVGDTLVVALPSNPSTGYRWALDRAPAAVVLEPHGEATYVPDPARAPMPGAGGTETFRYVAGAVGKTRLVLVYRRSWEPEDPTARRVTVEVSVREH